MNVNFRFSFKDIPEKPKVRIVEIGGEIDESSLDEFKKNINDCFAKGDIKVFIFLIKDLEFINSTVIGYFAQIFSNLKGEGKKMIFADGNEKILDIFELVGFFNLTEHHDNLEAAIDSLEF